MRSIVLAALIFACTVFPSVAADIPELSFEERVRAQAAIDRFYASHREGSRRNPAETAPTGVAEHKVLRYLRQTATLERFWNRTPVGNALEAELRRMMRQSRDRSRLRELFAILENDPNRIREMLVRPIVVDRAIRNAFKHSPPLRDSGEKCTLDFDSWWASVEHSITDWSTASLPSTVPLPEREIRIDPVAPNVPVAALSSVDDFHWRDNVFDAIGRRDDVTVWTGTELIIWGGSDTVDDLNTGMRYDPLLDISIPTSVDGAPEPRSYAKAVWTGTEMIVWGGADDSGVLSTGGRYDPATDTWTPVSQTGAPVGRGGHSAVWTGTEMIVWGGTDSSSHV